MVIVCIPLWYVFITHYSYSSECALRVCDTATQTDECFAQIQDALMCSAQTVSVADLAIALWVPLSPHCLDLVPKSTDDGPNGWLKEIKKAVALACFSRFSVENRSSG